MRPNDKRVSPLAAAVGKKGSGSKSIAEAFSAAEDSFADVMRAAVRGSASGDDLEPPAVDWDYDDLSGAIRITIPPMAFTPSESAPVAPDIRIPPGALPNIPQVSSELSSGKWVVEIAWDRRN